MQRFWYIFTLAFCWFCCRFPQSFIPCKNIHYRPDSTRLNATRFVLFTFKHKENFRTCPGLIECLAISDPDWIESYEQRTLIGQADLNLFIDHALQTNKTKTNKMDQDLRVFEWT